MRNQILWRCRRGTKELDLLLESYYRNNYNSWTEVECQLFENFLELSDEVLTSWLIEDKGSVTPEYNALVLNIKSNYLMR